MSALRSKVAAIMVICNEGDVLGQTLDHAARSFDVVVAVDAGSDDDSVAVLEEAARRHPNIVIAGRFRNKYAEQVRGRLWNRFHRSLRPGDWWVILDADEFIADDYREVLRQAEREGADHLFSRHINFYYTRSEYEKWLSGEETVADRLRPIAERRRFYVMKESMPRAFRNWPWTVWDGDRFFPRWVARPGSDELRFRHYQFRDWEQVEVRIETRNRAPVTAEYLAANPHWVPQKPENSIAVDGDPRLKKWEPGASFVLDPAAPPLPRNSILKSTVKYAFALARGCLHRAPADTLFSGPEGDRVARRIAELTAR